MTKTLPTTQSPGQNMTVWADQAQAHHSSLCFSSYPRLGTTTALCGLEAHLRPGWSWGRAPQRPWTWAWSHPVATPESKLPSAWFQGSPSKWALPLHRSLLTPWRGAQPDEAGCKAEFPVQCAKQCHEVWKKLRVNTEICRAVWTCCDSQVFGGT